MKKHNGFLGIHFPGFKAQSVLDFKPKRNMVLFKPICFSSIKRFNLLIIYVLAIIWSCSTIDLIGQDTIELPVFNVISTRTEIFTNALNIEKADSFMLSIIKSKNLGEALESMAGIQIRSYGYGGISMMAMRSGNSYQTAVLWNGFNLQDPLNGGINLYTLPGFFFDKMEIHRGGETALFGSGAMGGSIFINSGIELNKGFQLEGLLGFGSFDSYQAGVGIAVSKKNWGSKTRVFHRQAKNDFPFINNSVIGHPVDFQKNAAFNQFGVLHQNTFAISKNQKLRFDFWGFHSDNEVPSSFYQTMASGSKNINTNLKALGAYNFKKNKIDINGQTVLIYNKLQYIDPQAGLGYIHKSVSSISEVEAFYRFKPTLLLMGGLNNTWDRGFSESLIPNVNRNRTSFFVSGKWSIAKRLIFTGSLRQEFIVNQNIPYTYSIRAEYNNKKPLKLFVSHSKNYRLPTFNDLYWIDFSSIGNPSLKPEYGNTSEAGFAYEKDFGCTHTMLKMSYFRNMTFDLIQWISANGVWKPENFDQVKNSGIESGFIIKYCISSNHYLRFDAQHHYINSILLKTSLSINEENLNQQMIFVPQNKISFKLRWFLNKNFMEIKHNYTGKIYTTIDHSEFLPEYHISDLTIGRNISIQKSLISVSLSVMNIFNSEYRVMPGYPMPGVHYEFIVKYDFNK